MSNAIDSNEPKLTPDLKLKLFEYIRDADVDPGKTVTLQMYLFMLEYTDIVQQPITLLGFMELLKELGVPLPTELEGFRTDV